MVAVAKPDGAVTYSTFSGCQNEVRGLNTEGLRWIHEDSRDLYIFLGGFGSIQLFCSYLDNRDLLNPVQVHRRCPPRVKASPPHSQSISYPRQSLKAMFWSRDPAPLHLNAGSSSSVAAAAIYNLIGCG